MRQTVYTKVVNTTGHSTWLTFPWDGFNHPRIIRNVICPDGRLRTAYLGQDADTYFSWPARVKIGGKWIRGFVSVKTVDGLDTGEVVGMEFLAYTGK
jgi:hypothetical protein